MKNNTSGTPLTVAEKHAIRSMLQDSFTPKQMATALARSVQTVKKYLEGELANTVALVEEDKEKLPQEVYDVAFARLIKMGLSENDAKGSINKVRQKLTKILKMEDVDDLVGVALRQTSTKDSMILKADGGRKGVAAMTSGASMRMDQNKEMRSTRTSTGAIFRHKDGVVE